MPQNNLEQLKHEGEQHFLNGRFGEAARSFEQLLQIKPANPQYNFWFGACLLQLGKPEEAIPKLVVAHNADQKNVTVLNFLGAALQNSGRHEEAVTYFKQILRYAPENIAAKVNLAISLSQLEAHEQALELLMPFVENGSAGIDILYNAALCSQKLRKYDQAQALYEHILKLEPRFTDALINLGLVHRSLGAMQKAKQYFDQALQYDPENIHVQYNRASILVEEEKLDEAEAILLTVLGRLPDYVEALNDMGQVYFQRMQFHKAIAFFDRCVYLSPRWWHGFFNRALAYHELGELEKAEVDFRDALVLEPENQVIHFGLAETLLSSGKFAEGFEHYEYRLKYKFYHLDQYTIPLWQGESLAGKKIYIFEEQGSGDTMQFVYLLNRLKNEGATVYLQCNPLHKPLLQGLPAIDAVCTAFDPAVVATCDYYLPLLSLLHRLKLHDFFHFTTTPYIFAPEGSTCAGVSMVRNSSRKKIGLVWSGNKFSVINRKRHCTISDLLPLLRLPDYDFFSLQVDEARRELENLPESITVTDLAPTITNYADTAAIIAELDVVVSIDTSVAHLAGAMGKTVMVLLAKVPDWRWEGGRETCSWYPGMRLFRQQEQGNWREPVEQLVKSLTNMADVMFTEQNPLILALSSGENFGWGVCSKYIIKHLQNRIPIEVFQEGMPVQQDGRVVFHAIQGCNMDPLHPVRGRKNIGYTFFESLLTRDSHANAQQYDLVLGGSTWNKEKLIEAGITHSDVLIQGIDPEVFYPITEEKNPNLFVIFSGGKFELRKGQDLVLKAVGVLQSRYKDVILINAWYNLWPQVMNTMYQSPHITYAQQGTDWAEIMEYVYLINGLDRERILTLGLTPNTQLRNLYAKTDVGLFPNRCEGGTNLVMMEYMACAKPVIASYNTGHKDVLTESNSIPLKKMKPFPFHENGIITAEWEEADLEEMVEALDYAYHHRSEMKALGQTAGEYMKNFTWEKTALDVLRFAELIGRS